VLGKNSPVRLAFSGASCSQRAAMTAAVRGPSEIISAHVVHGLDVSDDRFDRGTVAQLALDGVSDAASLAGDV
jgi:hypothetical protein